MLAIGPAVKRSALAKCKLNGLVQTAVTTRESTIEQTDVDVMPLELNARAVGHPADHGLLLLQLLAIVHPEPLERSLRLGHERRYAEVHLADR